MKKNMGTVDRVARLVIAALAAYLYYNKIITGTIGVVLLILAGVFVLTSFIGFCPLYRLFGANTRPARKK